MKTGIMISEISFANMPILLKNAGLDYFILDCEHGGFDYADVARILVNARLCGLPSVVRLADNRRKDIVKYLDGGADGLLLPMTNTAEDIAEVVKYGKYPPEGKRGISTMRAHTLYDPPRVTEYIADANRRVKIYAQIETVAGVANVADILSVEGVAGVFVGPNDLSADFGCLDRSDAEEILQAIETVGKAAANAGKEAGIITGNGVYLAKAAQCGYRSFSVGSELNAVAEYCKKIREKVRNLQ